MNELDPVLYAIPAFVVTLVAEALYLRVRAPNSEGKLRGFSAKDALVSVSMGLGSLLVSAVTKVPEVAAYFWLYERRLFDLPVSWWSWLLLIIADDFCYWLYHAASHKVRLFWASHVNHHSSEYYNLSTALRQSWTKQLVTPWFWMILPLLGFHPWMVLAQQGFSLIYQYWIHTETVRSLGPLEWLLNTPSHHRVHHGSNQQYLDKNHAGIFIIWDRLFGTFEPEREMPTYGLTKDIKSYNLLKVAFHEYVDIARDVRSARNLREALMYVLGPPGWAPADRAAPRER